MDVEHNVFEPVSDHHWPGMESRHALMRRTPHHTVALQQREHFVWGQTGDKQGGMFANMTLDTSNNYDKRIVSMDRFAESLQDVECGTGMKLTFTTSPTFIDAIREWQWVNDGENRAFILIANYPGCTEANSREPWIVSGVQTDAATLTAYLNATRSSWKEATHGIPFRVDFGKYASVPHAELKRRFSVGGLIDEFVDKGKDVVDKGKEVVDEGKDKLNDAVEPLMTEAAEFHDKMETKAKEVATEIEHVATKAQSVVEAKVTSGIDKVDNTGKKVVDTVENNVQKLKDAIGDTQKSFTVDLNRILPEQIYSGSFGRFNLDLTSPAGVMTGTIQIMGNIDFDADGISSLVIEIVPKGVGIDLPLTFAATGVLRRGWTKNVELFTQGIPGFTVPKLFALGPTLKLEAGFDITAVSGSITASTGVQTQLNDGAKASVDVKKMKDLGSSGWKGSLKVKPFKVKQAQVDAAAEIYVTMSINLEATVLQTFGGRAGIALQIPVNLNMKAAYVKGREVCKGSGEDTGIEITGNTGFNVQGLALGLVAGRTETFWDNYLIDKSNMVPLAPLCVAFQLGKQSSTPTQPAVAIGGGGGGSGGGAMAL
ncbi:hypothetical protein BJ878DRAFT_545310 [Calycina marina]|uniref:Uncharacterized protein n=1 Tax=Calycina marina TaxID=1763456 RepID=A0A9P8CBY3_9HELO|nr:hypothetical protein BJ878DRAFT_545310 [Calycina marina]